LLIIENSHIQSIAFWFHKYDGSPEQIQHDRQFAEILVQAASFCYVRGFYERVESLSALVEQYAAHSTGDCELLLFENCWAKGAAYLQINKFEQACQCYEKAYELFQIALRKGNVKLPDGRQALACGLMGNGCMAMDEYEKAEEWYLKAFQIWSEMEEVPKDRLLYVSAL
jgi:tetratricopeptide (TPR) repeat protein